MWLLVQVLVDFILYFLQFLMFSGYQFQLIISSIRYSCINIIGIDLKTSEQMSKSGFFCYPDHMLVGIRNFQANGENPDEIGMVGKSRNCDVNIACKHVISSVRAPGSV